MKKAKCKCGQEFFYSRGDIQTIYSQGQNAENDFTGFFPILRIKKNKIVKIVNCPKCREGVEVGD